MASTRRELLLGGAGLVAAAVASCRQQTHASDGSVEVAGELAAESTDWLAVRALFDLDPGLVHLAGMLLASHPRPVRDAIERHRRALDDDPATFVNDQNTPNVVATRRAAAAYVGGRSDEIALTDSTSMGLGLVYTGLRTRPGQELLTTTSDYFVTHVALATLAERTGAVVKAIRLFKDLRAVSEDELVDTLLAGVGPKTRLVATTWVHSSTGLKMPIRRVADRIAALNVGRAEEDRIVLGVDGAHGFGVEADPVRDLGCDFLAAGTHKWMFGPRGTGIVWGHSRAHRDVAPTIPSFSAAAGWGGLMSPGGFKAFEHVWALAEAFALHRRLGRDNVARRTHELARRLKEHLSEMGHVVLYTPMEERLSSGVVCFDVRGLRPREVVARLRSRGIVASVTPYVPSYARFSPTIFNTPEEIDLAAGAVAALG